MSFSLNENGFQGWVQVLMVKWFLSEETYYQIMSWLSPRNDPQPLWAHESVSLNILSGESWISMPGFSRLLLGIDSLWLGNVKKKIDLYPRQHRYYSEMYCCFRLFDDRMKQPSDRVSWRSYERNLYGAGNFLTAGPVLYLSKPDVWWALNRSMNEWLNEWWTIWELQGGSPYTTLEMRRLCFCIIPALD